MNMTDRLRREEYPIKRKLLVVLAATVGIGAIFLVLVLLLGSCSAKLDGSIRGDGSARIDFQTEIPSPIAAKLRRLSASASPARGAQVGAAAPLFDLKSIRASIAARPELGLIELSQPTPESVKGAIFVKSLERFAKSPDLADSGALSYATGPGWAELEIRLERGNSAALTALLPGVDPYLLDALSPPALEEEGVSAAEYRAMLKSVLGEKAMPAMDAAAIGISLTAPNTVLASEGGALEGQTLKARIPMLDALVLEKPVELRLRWKH